MEFDLVVVGAGSGGYEAGLHAYRRGMKVAFVELSPDMVGGNCLNRGCIPSKYMRHGAYLIQKFKKMERYGILPKGYEVDFRKMARGRDGVVKTIRENFKKFAKQLGIPIFYGRGLLKGRNEVFVEGEEKRLKAKFVLLATGSSPTSVGGLKPDDKRIFDTDGIWSLEEVPKSILVLGGGAVGTEFAFIFRSYGSEVVLVELKERLLPASFIPEDSARFLARKLRELGVQVKTKTSLEEWKVEEDGVRYKLSDGTEGKAEVLLLAVGRKPNSEGLGLEEAGVELDERGFIKVNEFCETSVPNVYACGDLTSPLMLAHKAMYEGKVAVSHMLGEKRLKREERLMPKIVYSAVEVASVGLTEEEAEEEDIEVKVGVASFVFNPKAMDDGENEGFVRIVAEEESGEVLGCHVVGPHAGELVHQVVHLMRKKVTAGFLAESVYAHPSLSEAVGIASAEVHFGPISWIKRRK